MEMWMRWVQLVSELLGVVFSRFLFTPLQVVGLRVPDKFKDAHWFSYVARLISWRRHLPNDIYDDILYLLLADDPFCRNSISSPSVTSILVAATGEGLYAALVTPVYPEQSRQSLTDLKPIIKPHSIAINPILSAALWCLYL